MRDGSLSTRRSATFAEDGNYEVFDASGTVVALLFRDPESREWYEDTLSGQPQTHFSDRWRGSTKSEALAAIARRRSK